MVNPEQPPTVLYHYTCEDGLRAIALDRAIWPHRHSWLGYALVWLTDLDVPDRRELGLAAADFRSSDRTAHRIDVAYRPEIQAWMQWAHNVRIPGLVRDILEAGGARADHWWISPIALPVAAIDGVPQRTMAAIV